MVLSQNFLDGRKGVHYEKKNTDRVSCFDASSISIEWLLQYQEQSNTSQREKDGYR